MNKRKQSSQLEETQVIQAPTPGKQTEEDPLAELRHLQGRMKNLQMFTRIFAQSDLRMLFVLIEKNQFEGARTILPIVRNNLSHLLAAIDQKPLAESEHEEGDPLDEGEGEAQGNWRSDFDEQGDESGEFTDIEDSVIS